MATALPTGNLIVPVIKRAQEKNILGLTNSVNDLAKRARENRLQPDEISGGTFTITNVGSFGSVMGTPIINQPQVAILALGKIQKKPTVIETEYGDTVGIRSKMFLSLSYDHRVVDGALGGQFLQRICHIMSHLIHLKMKIICIGRNYKNHILELKFYSKRNDIFLKPETAIHKKINHSLSLTSQKKFTMKLK